jgi:urea carboxylase-associated protein 2
MIPGFSSTPDIPESNVRFREIVAPGANWSHVLKRGTTLRLVDTAGGANVSTLFYNAEMFSERYNMADTLKAQHISHLREGCAIYSDMGRVLVSIPQDTCGWHDTITGHSTAEIVARKFGEATFQRCRNDLHRNARDSFLVELGKYDLGLRDLVANVNFFSKVIVDGDGALKFIPNNSTAGAYVDLRSEMNTLVILNTCIHPLTAANTYDPKAIEVVVFDSPPLAADDPVLSFRPENRRGLDITKRYSL